MLTEFSDSSSSKIYMEIHVILILDRDYVDYYLLEFWPLLFKTTQCYKILKEMKIGKLNNPMCFKFLFNWGPDQWRKILIIFVLFLGHYEGGDDVDSNLLYIFFKTSIRGKFHHSSFENILTSNKHILKDTYKKSTHIRKYLAI